MLKVLNIHDDYIEQNNKKFFYIDYLNKNANYIKLLFLSTVERISENKSLRSNFKFNNLNLIDFFYSFEKNPYKYELSLLCKVLVINELTKKKQNFKIFNKINDPKLRGSIEILNKKIYKQEKVNFLKKFSWLLKSFIFMISNIRIRLNKVILKKNIVFTYAKFSNNNHLPIHWSNFDLLDKKELSNISFICFPITNNLLIQRKKFKRKDLIDVNLLISNSIFINSFLIYLKFFIKNLFINFSSYFKNDLDKAFINVLLYELHKDSLGFVLYLNLVYINFFDSFRESLNRNSKLFYIYENLSWQRIIDKTFISKTQPKCFAFQHSSIRFWDLRYFFTKSKYFPKNYLISNKYYSKYISKNFNMNFIKVENLKFNSQISPILKKKYKNKVLIFLDHVQEDNLKFIKILEKNIFLQDNYKFTFQHMHLNNFLKKNIINFKYNIINNTSPSILNSYNFYISVGASGSMEDVLQINEVPFIFNPNKFINLSPLEYLKKDTFFNNDRELINLLINKNKFKFKISNFYLGKNLKLWKNLLSS